MDWDHIRFFAVHREGSLRAAARRLGVDQTTAGRRVAALEQSLGAKLFVKTPTGYLTTPAGEALLASAERMAEEASAIGRHAVDLDTQLTGTVRVSAPFALAEHWLVPRSPACTAGTPTCASSCGARKDARTSPASRSPAMRRTSASASSGRPRRISSCARSGVSPPGSTPPPATSPRGASRRRGPPSPGTTSSSCSRRAPAAARIPSWASRSTAAASRSR